MIMPPSPKPPRFLEGKKLKGCGIAGEMLTLLRIIDRYLLVDRLEGWINWPSTECLCRKAFGVEKAFARCKVVGDWLKPKNAGKDWKSKVDWAACDKVDPSNLEFDGSRYEALEDEVKSGMEHDALMAKARAKLAEFTEVQPDRINGIPGAQ